MTHRTYYIFDRQDRIGGPFFAFHDAAASREAKAAPIGARMAVNPMVDGEPCEYLKTGPGRWRKSRIARPDRGDPSRLYGRIC